MASPSFPHPNSEFDDTQLSAESFEPKPDLPFFEAFEPAEAQAFPGFSTQAATPSFSELPFSEACVPKPPLQESPLPQGEPLPQSPPEAAPSTSETSLAERALALFLLLGGFCFWHFLGLAFFEGKGIGTTLFLLYNLVVSFVYLAAKGVRQNLKSGFMLAAAVAGALPFALYGNRDINFLLVCFDAMLCVLWVMYSCRTMVAAKLNLVLIADIVNQSLVVPFANFGRFFICGFSAAGKKTHSRPYVFFAGVGLLISIPLFILIINLLASSDEGFSKFLSSFSSHFKAFTIPRYAGELLLAVPLAAYLFASVFGNSAKRHVARFSEEGMLESFGNAHVVPRAMIYTPLLLLAVLYIVYFIAVGSYLFSGLQGQLPVTYTYAEYARRGFFELCAIAAINLLVLGFLWLCIKRGVREYPPLLRFLTAILSLLTCLLIITALSKMCIYVGAYGLTPLRLYTGLFMLFMLIAFVLIVAWHVKACNAARPIMIAALLFVLAVGLTDTNAIIADYNIERYLNGDIRELDLELLERLGVQVEAPDYDS